MNARQQSRAPAVPAAVSDVLHTPGRPLDAALRPSLESRFNHDFSRVRVHTDDRAAESAAAVGAHAWTVGSDIAFGRAMFAPSTPHGAAILAHELSHVVQQRDVARTTTPELGHPGDAYERDAESAQPQLRASSARLQGSWWIVGGIVAAVLATAYGLYRLLSDKFSRSELEAYLRKLRTKRKIEDDHDSDNKARACARREKELGPYSVDDRVLLIEEMLTGFTLGGDEAAILTLLRAARPGEPAQIVTRIGRPRLWAKFDGRTRRILEAITLTAADAGDALVTRLRDLDPAAIEDYITNATDQAVRASAQRALVLRRYTAPVPLNAAIDAAGEATFVINGIDVVARPDIESRDPQFIRRAFTQMGFELADIGEFSVDAAGIVQRFVPPRARAVVQTTYGPGTRPGGEAKYGRGTTDEDKREGRTTLRYHESGHGEDWFEFLRTNPLPPFTGRLGMTSAEYQRAVDEFGTALTAYQRRATEFSIRRSDCVGKRPPEEHFTIGEAASTICRQMGGRP